MNRTVIKCLLIIFTTTITISCDKEDVSNNSSTKNKSQSITKPEVKATSHYANGSYDGWYVIGTVTTGEPGTDAAATITGTAPNYVLNLTIPQGPTGPVA